MESSSKSRAGILLLLYVYKVKRYYIAVYLSLYIIFISWFSVHQNLGTPSYNWIVQGTRAQVLFEPEPVPLKHI